MTRYDCYLSYDHCSKSSLFQGKVQRIKSYLGYRNILVTTVDTNSSISERKRLYERIDRCGCIVLLLSSSFLEDRGQLRCEFGYFLRSKGRAQICVAVMDMEILDSTTWDGEIGGSLKGKRCIDFSSLDPSGLYFRRQLDELHDMITSVIEPLKVNPNIKD